MKKLSVKQLFSVGLSLTTLIFVLYFVLTPPSQFVAKQHQPISTETVDSTQTQTPDGSDSQSFDGNGNTGRQQKIDEVADNVQDEGPQAHQEIIGYDGSPEALGLFEESSELGRAQQFIDEDELNSLEADGAVDVFLEDFRDSYVGLSGNVDEGLEDDEVQEEQMSQEVESHYAGLNRRFDSALDGLFSGDVSVRADAVQQLWITGADLGVPDEALEALKAAVSDPDKVVADLAQMALEDLRRFSEHVVDPNDPAVLINTYIADAEEISSSSDGGWQAVAAEEDMSSEVVEFGNRNIWTEEQIVSIDNYIDDIEKTALEDDDPVTRGQAIDNLTEFRMFDTSLATLQLAALDPDPDNRYRAITSLWYIAMDGFLDHDLIMPILEKATNDTLASVSDLAKRAIEDIQQTAN